MKKQQSRLDPEKIQITNIQIFKASLETSQEYLKQPKEVKNFNIEIGHEMAHNLDDGMVRLRVIFVIKGIEKEPKEVVGLNVNYGLEYHFMVGNLKDLIQITSDNEQVMHLDLAATLFSMAYSTSRGIILERTQGTILGGVILPVVDPFKVLSSAQKTDS